MTTILGIDPGLNTTGYGVLRDLGHEVRVLEGGVVRSRARQELSLRVRDIHDGILEVIKKFQPQAIAIEELYSHYERPQTAILMGHARGVICLAAGSHDISVFHYAATKVKKLLTGNGRAPKSQVQLAVQREFSLPAPPDPPDVADALAIAMCHIYSRRCQAYSTPT